jgi:hypothetical protein
LGTINKTPGVGTPPLPGMATPPLPGVPAGNLALTGSIIETLVLLGLMTLALGTMLVLVARCSTKTSLLATP